MSDAPPEPWDKMVAVGRVARPHGLRGEVIVNPETDFPERRFRLGEVVYTKIDDEVQACRIQSRPVSCRSPSGCARWRRDHESGGSACKP